MGCCLALEPPILSALPLPALECNAIIVKTVNFDYIFQLSDTYDFTIWTIAVMQERCGNLFQNDSIAVPESFTKLQCPGLCTGHGTCVNSTCICSKNYTSIDCSVDKRRGPTVTSFRDGNTCDLQTMSDCLMVGIIGGNFMETSKSSCRTTKLGVRPPKICHETLTLKRNTDPT